MFLVVNLLLIYLILLISNSIHEFTHYLIAKKSLIQVMEVVIGYEKYSFNMFKNLYISIIPIGGFVSIVEEDLLKKSNGTIIMFYMLPACINIILATVLLSINININLLPSIIYGITYNYLIAIVSVIPFFKNSDLASCLKELKRKRKNIDNK